MGDYLDGKRERGLEFWGRKSNCLKMGVGKNIKLQGTLCTPGNCKSKKPAKHDGCWGDERDP